MDFSNASCHAGCSYLLPKLGYQNASDPNTTVINSTVAVPMEMREYRKYKLEIANVPGERSKLFDRLCSALASAGLFCTLFR